MTENITPETTKSSLLTKLRVKVWMARWSLLLWTSFAIAISIASWLLFPGAHFWVDGGLQGIQLVVSVDLILGPVLFMLVANPAKSLRERRLDAIALFSIQLLAMSWGGWQVYTQRPVALSYMPEGFALPLIARDFSQQGLHPDSLPASRIGVLPAFYVELPSGKDALAELLGLLNGKAQIAAHASLLKPLFDHEKKVFSSDKRFQTYWAGAGAADWQAWSAQHGSKPSSDYRFIMFAGRYGNAALVLDKNKQLVGHIRLPGEVLPAALLGN